MGLWLWVTREFSSGQGEEDKKCCSEAQTTSYYTTTASASSGGRGARGALQRTGGVTGEGTVNPLMITTAFLKIPLLKGLPGGLAVNGVSGPRLIHERLTMDHT